MDKSQKEKSSDTSAQFTEHQSIRIFGLPPEQFVLAMYALVLLGIPLSVIVAMAPFWDRVGDFTLVKQFNSFVAPAIDNLPYEYRYGGLPRFPLKRFLIASASMVELILLINFVALFARSVRRHALLVWMRYDRTKLLQYFGITCLLFCSLWYILFYDWKILAFAHSITCHSLRGCSDLIFVMAMPIVAVVFGHIAAIISVGAWQAASRRIKRL
jgi:hypothetical protein